MITKEKVLEIIEADVTTEGFFIVEVKVRKGNLISVYVDGVDGITIEYIKKISRLIEGAFDREVEDFELEVSSPGIGKPFKVIQQYYKCVGKTIEVVLLNESSFQGVLLEANAEGITIKVEVMEKREGEKRKNLHIDTHHVQYTEIKSAIEIITF